MLTSPAEEAALTATRTVLVVDDEPAMRTALTESLRRRGYVVLQAVDGRDALDRLNDAKPWLVLTDMKMPKLGGIALVREIKKRTPQTHVVVMTAFGSVETAVEAIKLGASDFLLKPFATDVLERVVSGLPGAGRDVTAPEGPRLASARPILSDDPAMRRLLKQVESVALSQATILIAGESGTGKELLARFIHSRSPRAQRPFVAVNCAALPDGLLESELFGHERGAFTGAIIRKLGKFELAHQGTILLDEISEMALPLQAKLLRVLQEREVDRIGGIAPVSVNIRVIATTNRPLDREVEQGRFREDLYYRLNVFPVTLPPLRERRADIPLLARHFVQLAASRNGVPAPLLSEAAEQELVKRTWKGNIRELENVVERAVLLAVDRVIEPMHIPIEPNSLSSPAQAPAVHPVSRVEIAPAGSLRDMERELIVGTLAQVNHNRTKAARQLGISVRTLRNKLREYRETGGEFCGNRIVGGR